MSDLRTRLERIGERARPTPDAFGRLERVRSRRERNRRISTGVVAFVVAAAGSIGIFALVGDDEQQVLGGGDGEFFALWPESTLEQAQAEQREVANAAPELQWRLDAEATALRFVDAALGWRDDPETLAVASTTSPDGTVTVELVKGVDPGPCQLPDCSGRDVTVTLRQLLPGAGIWSVVRAESGVFNIALHSGEEVEVGAEIEIAVGFEDGTEVAVGFAGTGSCEAFREETVEVSDFSIAGVVPDAMAGCTGYVFALTPATPVGQVELGRIMFVYHEPKPALGYTVQAVTALPVTFVDPSGTSSEPAGVGRIVCDDANPIVETPIVATQPDGVHVELSNPTDEVLSFSIVAGPVGDEATVSGLDPGLTELVLTVPPGKIRFSCASAPEEGQTASAGIASIEVVDPDGHYVSAELQCDGGSGYGSAARYPAGTVGERGEPLEIAQRRLTGLEPDDVLERAGYGGAPSPIVRIVRDGAIVGKVTLADDGHGGWLMRSVEGCGGTSFGWDESAVETGPIPRGWFDWCPEGPFLEVGEDWSERASEAAVQFAGAYSAGDEAALAELLDASVPADAEFVVVLAEGAEPTVGGTNAHGGGIVNYSCGNDVDAHTVAVTIDDGSDSASADFTVFLVLREDGWKAWGVY